MPITMAYDRGDTLLIGDREGDVAPLPPAPWSITRARDIWPTRGEPLAGDFGVETSPVAMALFSLRASTISLAKNADARHRASGGWWRWGTAPGGCW